MNFRTSISALAIAAIAPAIALSSPAQAVPVTITVENLAPDQGLILTPVWVGFHGGDYDLFEVGQAASEGLEVVAEDGSLTPLKEQFFNSGSNRVDGTIRGNGTTLLREGTTSSITVDVDPSQPFFSFASMILPSNDAFIGNDDPMGHRIFDESGTFIGADILVTGEQIYDAGTEVNDESLSSLPFLGDSHFVGPTENGTVQPHAGYIPGGTILNAHPNADFTQENYPTARITITLAQ